MTKKTLIIVGVLAAAGLYLLSRSAAAQKLKIYFKTLTVGKIKGFNIPEIFAQFSIVNPTNTTLTVDSIAGDIFVNKKLFTSFQNLNKVTIPANAEIIYPIKLQIQTLSAVLSIISLIKNKEKLNVYFDGTVNSSGFVIPIKDTIVQL